MVSNAPLPEKQGELLPCPFCGGGAKMFLGVVHCDNKGFCGAKLTVDGRIDSARSAWNRRAEGSRPSEVDREGVARIILGPKSVWNYSSFGEDKLNDWAHNPDVARALAKADKILALLSRPSEGERVHPDPNPSAHVAPQGSATATEALCDLEEAIRLAEIGEYLYDAKAFVAGDGHHEPREFSINWEWQQHKPNTFGEGALLAEATAWHNEMCETGIETQAARLRRVLNTLSSEAPSQKSEAQPSASAPATDEPLPAPQSEWRDIASAPRDGTAILVFAPGEDPRWSPRLSDLVSVCAWHPDAGFCVCELREPTHWMPLPAAPKSEEG